MFRYKLSPMKMIFLDLWLFLLFVGCQSPISMKNETIIVTQTIINTPTLVLPTSTPIKESNPTFPVSTPIWTQISTQPISPTVSLFPTLLPTNITTPWPTLSPDEASHKVVTLLLDNQNSDCLLPCWWGATPGKTYWQDIEPFLKSFAKKIYYSSSNRSYVAEVVLPLPESIIGASTDDYRTFYGWDESGVIHGIDVDSVNISGYDPVTMMTSYGVPDEVWLDTRDGTIEGVLPFQLIIVYQQQGISFRYYVNATLNGEVVTACFEPGFVEEERPELFPAGPRIYLWVPGEHKEIEKISPIPLQTYFPLASKTDLTVQTFYDRFVNSNEPPCIDTPANLW